MTKLFWDVIPIPASLHKRRSGFSGDRKKGREQYGKVVHPSDLAAFKAWALFLFPSGLLLLSVLNHASVRLAPLASLFISGVLHPLDCFPNTKKLTPCTMADVIKDRDVADGDHKKRGCKK